MKGCKREGELRAFLDGELPAAEFAAVRSHLAGCPACKSSAARLQTNGAWAQERLDAVRPEAAPPPAQAFARLQGQMEHQTSWKVRLTTMLGENNRRWRPALVALALIVVVAVTFLFEPLRVAAGDLLSVFRVQKFTAFSVGPDEMDRLEEIGEMLDQNFYLSEPIWLQEPEAQAVTTLDEASAAVGFAIRTPAFLPDGFAPAGVIQVSSRAAGQFQVDLEMARVLFETVGLDPALLPDSLGEKPLDFVMPAAATQTWKYKGQTGLTYLQVPSPEVSYPDDVDPQALAAAALQLLGMNAREARRLSESIDWTSTLVVPVPTDVASYSEVEVDGTNGLLLSSRYDGRTARTALMWQKDGIIHFLQGNVSIDTIVDIANSIR